MDRGPWQAIVRGVTQSQTRLKRLSTHAYSHNLVAFIEIPFGIISQCKHSWNLFRPVISKPGCV